ncbi:protein of unknown function [Pseudomonas sp. JV551A1]|uniref:Uncharacterized protein n=1 Tax=Pseudomonas inefficax TaxID=2078786 RepID=A0AAQ1P7D5_9PSED|nr:protein of unknown function [Pseudomonas sp. JV551A1]SPO59193.1 protein of unknown function [Pseudomonas inefficax]
MVTAVVLIASHDWNLMSVVTQEGLCSSVTEPKRRISQRILKELTKCPNGCGPYFLRKRSWWRGIQIAFISGPQSLVQKQSLACGAKHSLIPSQPSIRLNGCGSIGINLTELLVPVPPRGHSQWSTTCT